MGESSGDVPALCQALRISLRSSSNGKAKKCCGGGARPARWKSSIEAAVGGRTQRARQEGISGQVGQEGMRTRPVNRSYDTAEICLNGHMTNDRYEDYPQHRKDYCSECGEKTIHTCPACSTSIQGHYRGGGYGGDTPAPRFCHACGKAFPWTSQAMDAARELAAMSAALSDDELKTFAQTLEQLMRQTPLMALAGAKMKALIAKSGANSRRWNSQPHDRAFDCRSKKARRTLTLTWRHRRHTDVTKTHYSLQRVETAGIVCAENKRPGTT